jgi:hypothetical protein
MSAERYNMPSFQSDFFRDQFRKFLRWILVEMVVILGLLSAIAYYVFFQPSPHYFVTTTTGMTYPLDSGKVSMAGK